jgi:hypothetical protein
MTFSVYDFDKFLEEEKAKLDCIMISPDRFRQSDDGERIYVESFLGFFCYRNGICMGEAMNKEDAIAWVDTNKEIEMWT